MRYRCKRLSRKAFTALLFTSFLIVFFVILMVLFSTYSKKSAVNILVPQIEKTNNELSDTPGEFIYPEYNGNIAVDINSNIPFFTKEDLSRESFEEYSDLDELGRCGIAFASVGKDLMPIDNRGDISDVYPSGWRQIKHGDQWAYERCHLIAFCLTAENDNVNNLITGTHDFNQAMLPYEVEIAQWVEKTNGHCMVRVTPYFAGNELVCRGVLYEAYSVEDNGLSVCTCVFIHNVSNLFNIDYMTGETWQ